MLKRWVSGAACAVAIVFASQAWPTGSSIGSDDVRLDVLWHQRLNGRGSPAAFESTAFFLSRDHEVFAVDIESGRTIWRQPTGETGDALSGLALTVSGPVVVAGDYNLVAFDRATGSLRWRFVPRDGYGPGIYVGGTIGDLVVAGSPSGRIYAVNGESGALIWSTVVSSDEKTTVYSPSGSGSLVVAGFTQFVAPARGGVVALSAETGRVLWKHWFAEPADGKVATNWAGGPVMWNDVVIATSGDGTIYALDAGSGAVRWSIGRVDGPQREWLAASQDTRPLAIAGSTLISASLTGVVIGHDLESLKER